MCVCVECFENKFKQPNYIVGIESSSYLWQILQDETNIVYLLINLFCGLMCKKFIVILVQSLWTNHFTFTRIQIRDKLLRCVENMISHLFPYIFWVEVPRVEKSVSFNYVCLSCCAVQPSGSMSVLVIGDAIMLTQLVN